MRISCPSPREIPLYPVPPSSLVNAIFTRIPGKSLQCQQLDSTCMHSIYSSKNLNLRMNELYHSYQKAVGILTHTWYLQFGAQVGLNSLKTISTRNQNKLLIKTFATPHNSCRPFTNPNLCPPIPALTIFEGISIGGGHEISKINISITYVGAMLLSISPNQF